MKKRVNALALFATVFALAACSSPQSSAAPSSSQQGTSSAAASSQQDSSAASSDASGAQGEKYLFYTIKEGQTKDGLTGSPWLNPTVAGVVSKIEKPSLKDDFFIASNYNYLSTATLAEGQIGDGGTMGALSKLQENYVALSNGTADKGNYAAAIKKANELYSTEDGASNIAAVKKLLGDIKAIQNKNDLFSFLTSKKGATFPWSLFELRRNGKGAEIYDDNMGWNISSSVLPFMNASEAEMQNVIDKMSPALVYFGFTEDEAKNVIRSGLEADANLRSKPMTSSDDDGYKVSALNDTFPNLKLGNLFKNLGYQDNDVIKILGDIFNILYHIDELSDNDLNAVKNDLMFRVCLGAKTTLPLEMYMSLAQEFDSNSSGYNQEMFVRERFIDALRNIYDRSFIDNFETPERKAMILSLMEQVKSEYALLLDGTSWLGNETKAKAKEKVGAIRYDACYPDHLMSLPTFTLNEEISSFYDVHAAYREWSYAASQPAASNPDLWAGSITTLNAVYYPYSNSFVYYDGLLASNPYTANDIEGLYGSVGAIIGHEISHSFDNNGSQYDKDGRQNDWWTDEDRQTFETKSQKIVNAWNGIYYKDGVTTWGAKMLGEIIADMGGVSVMLRLGAKKENFDYAKFFNVYSESYASVFNEMFVEEMFYKRQDEHPMNYLRVNNVLNQYPKFHEVFDIKEGDKMYVAETDRLPIW